MQTGSKITSNQQVESNNAAADSRYQQAMQKIKENKITQLEIKDKDFLDLKDNFEFVKALKTNTSIESLIMYGQSKFFEDVFRGFGWFGKKEGLNALQILSDQIEFSNDDNQHKIKSAAQQPAIRQWEDMDRACVLYSDSFSIPYTDSVYLDITCYSQPENTARNSLDLDPIDDNPELDSGPTDLTPHNEDGSISIDLSNCKKTVIQQKYTWLISEAKLTQNNNMLVALSCYQYDEKEQNVKFDLPNPYYNLLCLIDLKEQKLITKINKYVLGLNAFFDKRNEFVLRYAEKNNECYNELWSQSPLEKKSSLPPGPITILTNNTLAIKPDQKTLITIKDGKELKQEHNEEINDGFRTPYLFPLKNGGLFSIPPWSGPSLYWDADLKQNGSIPSKATAEPDFPVHKIFAELPDHQVVHYQNPGAYRKYYDHYFFVHQYHPEKKYRFGITFRTGESDIVEKIVALPNQPYFISIHNIVSGERKKFWQPYKIAHLWEVTALGIEYNGYYKISGGAFPISISDEELILGDTHENELKITRVGIRTKDNALKYCNTLNAITNELDNYLPKVLIEITLSYLNKNMFFKLNPAEKEQAAHSQAQSMNAAKK